MKLLVALLLGVYILQANEVVNIKNTSVKNLSVLEEKKRFYSLVVPAVQKVHAELSAKYKRIKKDIGAKKNTQEIKDLKHLYRVTTDEELLLALKPHPVSIAIAQAAIESAWATSHIFLKANNLFGVWSVNKNDDRIAAAQKRKGGRTIWLRKFKNVEGSIRTYYLTIARVKVYKKLREYRMKTDDVFEIIKGLDKYSERGTKYVDSIGKVIRHNNLTKYDKR